MEFLVLQLHQAPDINSVDYHSVQKTRVLCPQNRRQFGWFLHGGHIVLPAGTKRLFSARFIDMTPLLTIM